MIGSWTVKKATIVGYLVENTGREDWLLLKIKYLAKTEKICLSSHPKYDEVYQI